VIGILAIAAQLSIVVHAPDTARTCDAIEVTIAVSGAGRSPQVPRLVAPSFAPFDVLRSSSVPHVSYSPGTNTVTAEYRYVLTTDRVGAFGIGAFEARLGSATARSRPLEVVVRGTTRSTRPIVVARARIDTSLDVKTSALTLPETVFVGQQANYEVAVFLNETVRERLRRNPTFFPPDMQSMLAYDLPARGDAPRRQGGSRCFDALVYQRALFPLMPGRFAIPPAQLVYSLPLSSSFFAREETHELQTDSTVIVAVEPPSTGRPSDYGGAVGNLHVAAKLDTVGSRVGDPMTLTVRVSGTGNVKLFPRPAVGVEWANLVKGDERVQVDTNARKIAGAKEFDWVLTPKVAGELDLPPIRYSYFNPETRRYETALTNPTHLRVANGSLASADTARTEALLALRTRYRGVPSAPLHEHPIFWVALALVPIPAVSLRARRQRNRRPVRPVSAVTRLTNLTRDDASARDACEVRRVYTLALGERLGLSPESFTRSGALARALRRRGVSTEVALDAERFLRQLDEAAFSASGALPADSAARAQTLYETVDEEALPRSSISTSTIASLCLVLVAIGVAAAQAGDAVFARTTFDAGVAAYARHDFATARDAFVASVRAEPRAPDGWANLGTAAWAVADTATSVASWQRALRMEPLANDVRERVELAHSLPLTSAGYVPPMPASWVFNLAALLWLAAWGASAYRTAKGRDDLTRETALVAVVAGMMAIGGFVVSERLAGRHLAVVRQTTALRGEPDLAGTSDATAIVGEVVRVGGRQGAWSRVVLDDGRDGWIATDSMLSLDARDGEQIATQ
jgi:hypothetical protein